MSAFGYCRVSTERQGDGDSLDVQKRQIEGYAMIRGLDLADIVIESGVSGSVPVAQREAAGPLFATLKRGDIVISPKLDRLFRSALDALQTVESLKKRGVTLHLVDLGEVTDGLSKVVLTILAAVAEGERDVIRQRAKASKADKRKRGLYLGGVVPFGYRRGESGELVPHGGEQGAIEDIRVLRAQGEPLRAISAALAAKGFKLSHEGVARVLRTREAA